MIIKDKVTKDIVSREKKVVDIDPSATHINVNERERHIVKLGDKFITKNNPASIMSGKARFLIVDKPYKFASPILANEAVNFFKAKGKKAVMERVMF